MDLRNYILWLPCKGGGPDSVLGKILNEKNIKMLLNINNLLTDLTLSDGYSILHQVFTFLTAHDDND